MTAQPQRLRSLRHPDENAVASQHNMPPAKSIHQRNKSTPAVSIAALRPNPQVKRAAFADVSNTTRHTHLVKDDHALNQKPAAIVDPPTSRNLDPATTSIAPQQKLSRTVTTLPSQNSLPPFANTSNPLVVSRPLSTTTRKLQIRKQTTTTQDLNVMPLATAEQHLTDHPLLLASNTVSLKARTNATAASSEQAQVRTSSAAAAAALALRPSSATAVVPSHSGYSGSVVLQTEQQLLQALEQQAQTLEADRNAAIALSQDMLRESLGYYQDEESQTYVTEGFDSGRNFRTKAEVTVTSVVVRPNYSDRDAAEIDFAKKWVANNRSDEDIEDESWDTSMVAEYGDEIFDYFRELELRMTPSSSYMDHQTECQWSMRAVLMDWLIQVHQRFGLLPETLFLAVNFIDRFLTVKIVSLAKLQLVGATALFLASKYEEVNCPSIAEVVYMVDNGYSADEILKAERFMLSMLKFELGWPGPMSFLRRISKADDYDLETRTLAKYFLEVTIMDERFVGCPPSFLAAGAHCLARMMLRKGDWTQSHVYYADYTYSQLHTLLSTLVECCEDAEKHHTIVFEKYSDKRFRRASTFVQAEFEAGRFQLPAPRSPVIATLAAVEADSEVGAEAATETAPAE